MKMKTMGRLKVFAFILMVSSVGLAWIFHRPKSLSNGNNELSKLIHQLGALKEVEVFAIPSTMQTAITVTREQLYGGGCAFKSDDEGRIRELVAILENIPPMKDIDLEDAKARERRIALVLISKDGKSIALELAALPRGYWIVANGLPPNNGATAATSDIHLGDEIFSWTAGANVNRRGLAPLDKLCPTTAS